MEWNEIAIAKCEAMLKRLSKSEEGGCQTWTGGTIGRLCMYGRVMFGNIETTAHRFSYMLHMRLPVMDNKLHVRHMCKNSLCIAPNHLTVGSPSENAHDRIAHGTSAHGRGAKVNIELARAIKNSKGQGTRAKRARQFDVPYSLVRGIDCGRAWAWLGTKQEEDDKSRPSELTKTRRAMKRKTTEDFSSEDLKRARAFIFKRVSNPRSNTLCAIWQGGLHKGGYGVAQFTRPTMRKCTFLAHRLSYQAFNNLPSIAVGQLVRHICIGNKSCVNPLHLELGTAKDNTADQVRDGTRSKGETHVRASIIEETALAILHSKGEGTQKQRAVKLHATIDVVRQIDSGKSWKHLRT